MKRNSYFYHFFWSYDWILDSDWLKKTKTGGLWANNTPFFPPPTFVLQGDILIGL